MILTNLVFIVTIQVQSSYKRVSHAHPKICAVENTAIPANSQVLLQARIDNSPPEGAVGFVSPNHYLGPKHNLICANALATNVSQSCPVLLLNPTQEDITLYKGTTLGYFQVSDSNFDSIDLGTMHEACAVQAISPNDEIVPSDEVCDDTDPPNVDLSKADLTEAQKHQLRHLLMKYRCVFANNISELSMANTPHHEIDVGDARPIKSMPFRYPPDLKGES